MTFDRSKGRTTSHQLSGGLLRVLAYRYLHKRWLARGVILAGLAAFTIWHGAYPEALADAEAAYGKSDLVTAARRACDRLDSWLPSPRAALVAALSLSRLDFAEQAEPYYQRTGSLGFEELHHRAFGLVRGNHRESAILAYQEILSRRPDDVLASRRQAAVLISRGQRNEAMRLAERLTRIPKGEVIGYALLGVLNNNMGEPELAVAAFERVLALDPDLKTLPLYTPEQFWRNFGMDLIALGRYADARHYMSRALAGGNNAILMTLMGEAYYRDSMLEDAERCWQKASEWDPKLPIVWLHLGRLALTRGQPREAIPLLERAARLAPVTSQPLYSLGLAHGRLGHNAEAERYRRQADIIRAKSAATSQNDMGAPPVPPS